MDDRVNELLVRWEKERLAGRDLSAEELCALCPEMVGQVREGIRKLLWVNSMNDHLRDDAGALPTWAKGASPLPGFRLLEDGPFAGGGSGEVWRAEASGEFRVVLKRVSLGGGLAADEERAMKLLPTLSPHINLLKVWSVHRLGRDLVIVMEEADESLMDRLEPCPDGLPVEELLLFMRDAAEGVDHLNRQDVLHRDIKPGNLLLVSGRVKVGDYGLAKVLERTRESHTGFMSLPYAAPECFKGHFERQSDQYSLAVTYFHLRTGHLPVDLSQLLAFEAKAVEKALSLEPKHRWSSCLAFVQALEAALKPASAPLPDQEDESPEFTLLDELVLLSRDDQTGKRLANSDFKYALSGAILAELVWRKRLALHENAVEVLSNQTTGDDVLDCDLGLEDYYIAERRLAKPGRSSLYIPSRPPSVSGYRGEAVEKVILDRLVKRGILRETEFFRLFIFKSTLYPAHDSGPKLRLMQRLVGAFATSSDAVPRRLSMLLALLHESENWPLVALYAGGSSSQAQLERLFGTKDEATTVICAAVKRAIASDRPASLEDGWFCSNDACAH